MTIMVDELFRWPGKKPRCFNAGSCHLTVDNGLGNLDELHAFAKRIGLKREWFQNHRTCPHYDLTAAKRWAAIEAGAVVVSGREQAQKRFEARQSASPGMPAAERPDTSGSSEW